MAFDFDKLRRKAEADGWETIKKRTNDHACDLLEEVIKKAKNEKEGVMALTMALGYAIGMSAKNMDVIEVVITGSLPMMRACAKRGYKSSLDLAKDCDCPNCQERMKNHRGDAA